MLSSQETLEEIKRGVVEIILEEELLVCLNEKKITANKIRI